MDKATALGLIRELVDATTVCAHSDGLRGGNRMDLAAKKIAEALTQERVTVQEIRQVTG